MDVLWEDLSFQTILEKKKHKTSRNFPFYVFILYSLFPYFQIINCARNITLRKTPKKKRARRLLAIFAVEYEVEVENNKTIKSERTT